MLNIFAITICDHQLKNGSNYRLNMNFVSKCLRAVIPIDKMTSFPFKQSKIYLSLRLCDST